MYLEKGYSNDTIKVEVTSFYFTEHRKSRGTLWGEVYQRTEKPWCWCFQDVDRPECLKFGPICMHAVGGPELHSAVAFVNSSLEYKHDQKLNQFVRMVSCVCVCVCEWDGGVFLCVSERKQALGLNQFESTVFSLSQNTFSVTSHKSVLLSELLWKDAVWVQGSNLSESS